jgi:hypothetical protein
MLVTKKQYKKFRKSVYGGRRTVDGRNRIAGFRAISLLFLPYTVYLIPYTEFCKFFVDNSQKAYYY